MIEIFVNNLRILFCLAAVVAWGCENAKSSAPRLLLTQEALQTVIHKIHNYPWARQQWEEILASADETLLIEVNIPPRGGNWPHYYVSPDDGRPLVRGEQIGPRKRRSSLSLKKTELQNSDF